MKTLRLPLYLLSYSLISNFLFSAELVKCEVSNGYIPSNLVTFNIPKPKGFQFLGNKKACNLFLGETPRSSSVLIHIFAVNSNDAGPEQLLNNTPDGAVQWLSRTLKDKVKRIASGEIVIQKENATYFRVHAKPRRIKQIKEIVVTRIKRKNENIVLLAFYPINASDTYLPTVLEVFGDTKFHLQADKK